MKKLFKLVFVVILFLGLYYTYQNKEKITKYITDLYIDNQKIVINEPNIYKRDYDFNYIKNTDNFRPNNYQELLNVFYTILNNGWSNFTFYCGKKYDNCLEDVDKLVNNNQILSNINNYVHPYNSYQSIFVSKDYFGQINVIVNKLYNDEDIEKIDQRIDSIIKQKIKSNMSDKEKIKVIHDYIINTTSYDKKQESQEFSNGITVYKYSSNKATGPVLYGKAICSGYTDYMMLFLEKLGIKSYKISSKNHVWNYVFIDGNYKHLDLTWDDPITYDGKYNIINTLIHDYFLIDTNKLLSLDKTEHTYDEKVF